uniref:Regulatory protein zeste n=1 Tax=Timema tahoe TaxID=61484 RepID=A0A7R9P1C1_9NEOP|nr:unnamed protein product [Timema tahoe]
MSQNIEKTKKTLRFTAAQIAELVDYMSTHSDLASGRFSCAAGNSAMDRQWKALGKILEEHGPKKTVWRDLKCKVRARLADVNRASRATGNTTYAPPLTEIEKKVLAIIGTASAIGVPSMEEHGLEVELATGIGKFASAQEGLQSVASTIDKAVAAQLESNNLQAEANRNITALLTKVPP